VNAQSDTCSLEEHAQFKESQYGKSLTTKTWANQQNCNRKQTASDLQWKSYAYQIFSATSHC